MFAKCLANIGSRILCAAVATGTALPCFRQRIIYHGMYGSRAFQKASGPSRPNMALTFAALHAAHERNPDYTPAAEPTKPALPNLISVCTELLALDGWASVPPAAAGSSCKHNCERRRHLHRLSHNNFRACRRSGLICTKKRPQHGGTLKPSFIGCKGGGLASGRIEASYPGAIRSRHAVLICRIKEMAPSRVGSAPEPSLGNVAVPPHRDVQL
jgi:hypothetical protein